jgi:hypothetical protein
VTSTSGTLKQGRAHTWQQNISVLSRLLRGAEPFEANCAKYEVLGKFDRNPGCRRCSLAHRAKHPTRISNGLGLDRHL